MGTLSWGRRYLMVRPDHYRIAYAINPFMDLLDQPDRRLALEQWSVLASTLAELGARVEVMEQRPDSPDMVYAMNLGLVVADRAAPRSPGSGPARTAPAGTTARAVMSHMRYPQRRQETSSARGWFADHDMHVDVIGADGVGPCFEAGDAFPWAGELVVASGPRTDALAHKALALELGVRVRGLRIVHPAMYHLDLAFCPLDTEHALVCPAAFDPPSARALLDRIPHPHVLSVEEALSMCANSVVVDRTVVMPTCPARVRASLDAAGFTVQVVDVSQFHKGGGSIRCLTNPLDITYGRDLEIVPGGEVTGFVSA